MHEGSIYEHPVSNPKTKAFASLIIQQCVSSSAHQHTLYYMVLLYTMLTNTHSTTWYLSITSSPTHTLQYLDLTLDMSTVLYRSN